MISGRTDCEGFVFSVSVTGSEPISARPKPAGMTSSPLASPASIRSVPASSVVVSTVSRSPNSPPEYAPANSPLSSESS